MTQNGKYHGGLVFEGSVEGALDQFSRIVTSTLEDYGHHVERRSVMGVYDARIVSGQYLIRLHLEADIPVQEPRHRRIDRIAGLKTALARVAPAPRNRLVISMSPVSDLLDDRELSEMMLVVILYRLVEVQQSTLIEWLSPNASLTVEQFMTAFSSLAPQHKRSRKQLFSAVCGPFPTGLADNDNAEIVSIKGGWTGSHQETGNKPKDKSKLFDDQVLALTFRADPDHLAKDDKCPQEALSNDLQRLTSWCMTGVVAFLATPVAVSLAAVNLIRGEDFRLNTQVLSYTAAIVLLESSGAYMELASALGL